MIHFWEERFLNFSLLLFNKNYNHCHIHQRMLTIWFQEFIYSLGDNFIYKVLLICLNFWCQHFRIQSGMLDSLGQLARFYSPMLLSHLVAILLLTLREQLRTMMETGQCIMFHTALGAGAKPYYILPAVKIGARVLGYVLRNEKIIKALCTSGHSNAIERFSNVIPALCLLKTECCLNMNWNVYCYWCLHWLGLKKYYPAGIGQVCIYREYLEKIA